MKPTLLVLAAGMGSRYGGLKQIDPMGPSGETILDYSVFDALRAGFGKVVFIIRPDFEKDFRERIAAKFAGRIEVGFAFQTIDQLPVGFSVPAGREKPWGTTHAILCARDAVTAPFAVINADDFYGRDSYATLGRYLAGLSNESTAYAMVGFTLKNTLSEHGTVARGVCQTDAGGNHRVTLHCTTGRAARQSRKRPRGVASARSSRRIGLAMQSGFGRISQASGSGGRSMPLRST